MSQSGITNIYTRQNTQPHQAQPSSRAPTFRDKDGRRPPTTSQRLASAANIDRGSSHRSLSLGQSVVFCRHSAPVWAPTARETPVWTAEHDIGASRLLFSRCEDRAAGEEGPPGKGRRRQHQKRRRDEDGPPEVASRTRCRPASQRRERPPWQGPPEAHAARTLVALVDMGILADGEARGLLCVFFQCRTSLESGGWVS